MHEKGNTICQFKVKMCEQYIKEGAEIQTVPDVALLSHFNFRAAPGKSLWFILFYVYYSSMCE